ncbi:TIGR01440 family protein [Paenibacillus xylanilyticus]|uniref:TIGR01440 family protein n=1 Tax=Paenibacillus xylanilyticus TaxID=248903 RepID=UPI00129DD748|nr:TIGR01440 family protein [Paenibacillus xylanilyticus]
MTIELDSDQPGLQEQTVTILRELALAGKLGPGQIVVIGTSTSEVAGQKIGTSGAVDVAQQLLAGIREVQQEFGFEPVFQCCEHLNRALVMERSLLTRLGLTEVGAVPVPKAGGSMASAAYRSLNDPCLAEHVHAHAGVDIGETMIGMHLRHVAVPFRTTLRYIGEARVTTALTRPKLIGGERAVYQMEEQPDSTFCD